MLCLDKVDTGPVDLAHPYGWPSVVAIQRFSAV